MAAPRFNHRRSHLGQVSARTSLDVATWALAERKSVRPAPCVRELINELLGEDVQSQAVSSP